MMRCSLDQRRSVNERPVNDDHRCSLVADESNIRAPQLVERKIRHASERAVDIPGGQGESIQPDLLADDAPGYIVGRRVNAAPDP